MVDKKETMNDKIKNKRKLKRIRRKEKHRINEIKTVVDELKNNDNNTIKEYVGPMINMFTLLEKVSTSKKMMMSILINKNKKIPQTLKEKMMKLMDEIKNDYDTMTKAEKFPVSFKREIDPMIAANGHLEVVKYLIERGADVHADNDYYALRYSAGKGHLEVVKYLIEKGANIDVIKNYPIMKRLN